MTSIHIPWIKKGSDAGTYTAPRSREAVSLFHWKILLGTFFVLTVCVLASGFFVYRTTEGGLSPTDQDLSGVSTGLTLSKLEEVIGTFEERYVTFDQVRKSTVRFADPSK